VELKAKSQKMLAYLTGIQPHPNAINVGGCTATPTLERLMDLRDLWLEQAEFVNNVYLPDVIAVGTGPLLPLAASAFGATAGNYLCYSMLPQDGSQSPGDTAFGGSNHLFRGGVIMASGSPGSVTDLSTVTVQEPDYDQITESVTYSWYDYPQGIENVHPSEGITEFNTTKLDAYSFLKAPRYASQPMEVGPLARGMVNKFPELAGYFAIGGREGVVARHLSRAVISKMIIEEGLTWIDRLIAMRTAGPIIGMNEKPVPKSAKGMGLWDAPRGALGHWVEIDNHRIKNYQLVVPSTWNAGPRDENGAKGPYEQALIGAPVPDLDNPINIVRIIRSFDPCIACAVHIIDPHSNDIKVVKIP
jgi:hydrogenase large subunit